MIGLRDHIPKSKKRKIGDAGRKSERGLAKSLGAQLRPASGAMAGAKGDMKLGDFLIEAKSTVADSLTVKYDWLGKISGEALSEGRAPALTVTFTHPNGKPVNFGQWVLIPLHVWQEMVESE